MSADDEVRPALPEHPGELAEAGWWLYRLHQDLISLRRRNPWITHAQLEVLDKTNTTLDYRVHADGNSLEVHIDLDHAPNCGVTVNGEWALSWPR